MEGFRISHSVYVTLIEPESIPGVYDESLFIWVQGLKYPKYHDSMSLPWIPQFYEASRKPVLLFLKKCQLDKKDQQINMEIDFTEYLDLLEGVGRFPSQDIVLGHNLSQ